MKLSDSYLIDIEESELPSTLDRLLVDFKDREQNTASVFNHALEELTSMGLSNFQFKVSRVFGTREMFIEVYHRNWVSDDSYMIYLKDSIGDIAVFEGLDTAMPALELLLRNSCNIIVGIRVLSARFAQGGGVYST